MICNFLLWLDWAFGIAFSLGSIVLIWLLVSINKNKRADRGGGRSFE